MGVFSLTFLDPFVCCCFFCFSAVSKMWFFSISMFFLSTCSSSDEFHWYTARDHRFIFILSFHFSSLLMPTFMGFKFFSLLSLLLEILSLLLPHSIGAFLLHKLTHTHAYKLFRAFIWTRVEWQQFSNDNNCSAFQNVSQWMAQNCDTDEKWWFRSFRILLFGWNKIPNLFFRVQIIWNTLFNRASLCLCQ